MMALIAMMVPPLSSQVLTTLTARPGQAIGNAFENAIGTGLIRRVIASHAIISEIIARTMSLVAFAKENVAVRFHGRASLQ
jgi:hypothetical protein